MKRRTMTGIPKAEVSFGEIDTHPFAPLYRRLGIRTYTHRLAVLTDPQQSMGRRPCINRSWDSVNRVWSDNHLYRASITLPAI